MVKMPMILNTYSIQLVHIETLLKNLEYQTFMAMTVLKSRKVNFRDFQ